MTLIEKLQTAGYRRLGSPRSGFRYVDPAGHQPCNGELQRIRALRLPPGWSEVYVNREAGTKLQAVGRDKAGRWQYRYHPTYRRRQENAKFRRLLRFAQALPRMRAAVDRDLRRRGLPREKVLAAAVHIMATCFMRPGSGVYADENDSHGIATIKKRHVSVEGDLVRFDYRGKSGKRQVREVRDARIARLVNQLDRLPGSSLLQFVTDEGTVVDVRRRHINGYIKENMGDTFTAKDFRTWAGTLICACELARNADGGSPVSTRGARKKIVAAALKATAGCLGNTPAVCRSSYVFPAVIEGFSRGLVIQAPLEDVAELGRQRALHRSERALLRLLGASVRAPPELSSASGRAQG